MADPVALCACIAAAMALKGFPSARNACHSTDSLLLGLAAWSEGLCAATSFFGAFSCTPRTIEKLRKTGFIHSFRAKIRGDDRFPLLRHGLGSVSRQRGATRSRYPEAAFLQETLI
jgi:hypothetical protein